MYACIYCGEDNSITVLQQTSQKLHLPEDGEFKLRQNVTFEWRKKSEVFSGVIVRIGDDEDKLTEWGTKAYKQILKPKPVSKDSSESDIICKLINFSGVPAKLPPKRSKKQTEKALLSKEQEDELEQPKAKKPKTNFHVQRKLLTELQSQFKRDDQPSNEKTRGHTQGTTAGEQTPDTNKDGGQTPLESVTAVGQTPDTRKAGGPKQQETGIAAGQTPDNKKDSGPKQQETGIAAGQTPYNKKDSGPKQQRNGVAAGQTLDTKKDDRSEQQETGIAAGQTPDNKKDGVPKQQKNGIAAGQTLDTKKDDGSEQQETGIAASDVHYGHSFWHTGVDQSWSQNTFGTPLTETWALCSDSNDQTGNARRNELPVPPQEVLQFFRAMRQPHVQAYMDSFLQYYDNVDNPDQFRMSGFGFMAEPLARPTFHTLQSALSRSGVNPGRSFSGMHTDMSLPTMESLENSVTPRRSPRKHLKTPQGSETPHPPKPANMQSDSNPDKLTDTPVSTTDSLGNGVTPRRSPRKHFNTPQGSEDHVTPRLPKPANMQSDSDPDKIRLLPEKDLVWVTRQQLRKATTAAAKKKDNAGYVLMYNLLTCAFTTEEMAESRGTGIGRAAPGFENRSVLDVNKITDLKEFVNRWTKKNIQRLFPDKDLNSAVTERCSYCRVQLKRANR